MSIKRLPLMILLAVLGLGFILGTYQAIIGAELTRGATDLYPTWKAAQLFFQEGVSPYDARVGVESQDAIYGRPAEAGEDEFLYVYPFYNIFFVAPFAYADYDVTAAIVMEVMLLSLVAGLVLMLDGLRWLPSPLTLGMLLLFTIASYFSVRGLLLAQPAIPAYLGHMLALWGILRRRDSIAGVGLVLATLKPQTGYLIVPLLLLWAWRAGRLRLVWAFVGGFGLLMGLSFLLQPTWFADWLEMLAAYESYTETIPAARIVAEFLLPDSIAVAGYALLALLLLIPVFRFWWHVLLHREDSAFLWGYFLTLTVSLLIAPRVATTYYVELYPVLYITALVWARERRDWLTWLAGLVSLPFFWGLHIATVPPIEEGGAGREAPIVYVVFPVVMLALLWLYRRAWPPVELYSKPI